LSSSNACIEKLHVGATEDEEEEEEEVFIPSSWIGKFSSALYKWGE